MSTCAYPNCECSVQADGVEMDCKHTTAVKTSLITLGQSASIRGFSATKSGPIARITKVYDQDKDDWEERNGVMYLDIEMPSNAALPDKTFLKTTCTINPKARTLSLCARYMGRDAWETNGWDSETVFTREVTLPSYLNLEEIKLNQAEQPWQKRSHGKVITLQAPKISCSYGVSSDIPIGVIR